VAFFIYAYRIADPPVQGSLMSRSTVQFLLTATNTTLIHAGGSALAHHLRIAISPEHLASTCFPRSPPSASDIENAITVVEDAIMMALREAERKPEFPPELQTDTETFALLTRALGMHDVNAIELSIESVEHAFSQLADIANGAPSGRSAIPLDALSVAHLVLLREVMHHLHFTSLRGAAR
jgi:hypothetical protein